MQPLRVEVWSDIACPWCWIGKRRLEAALERFPEREHVEVVWRAFELDPSRPAVEEPTRSYAERLAQKYGTSPAAAEGMIRTMTETAAREGLDYRFDRIRPGNTFDAHRVAHIAREHGLGDGAEERLMRAYLTEGECLGERETLVRLAAEIGLERELVREALAGDVGAREVRADEAEAHERGIRAVPHFVIGGRRALSGAQPPEILLAALREVGQELERERSAGAAPAEACGPDGCT